MGTVILWIVGGAVGAVALFVIVARILRLRSIPKPNPQPKVAQVIPLALAPEEVARFPVLPPVVHHLYDIDPDEGWPPKVSSAVAVQTLAPAHPAGNLLDGQREDRLRQRVMGDPRLAAHQGGRWAYFGTHHVEQRNYSPGGPLHTRHSFYNYDGRYAVDVLMKDDEIVAVDKRGGHLPPESPGEVNQAIALARGDARLKGQVEQLESHAILQSPADSGHPLFKHRSLWVVFSAPDDPTREMPALFTALVDLTEQRVVWAGAAPCAKA
jgi:hypothetical protein